MSKPFRGTDGNHRLQTFQGNLQGHTPGALHQRAGVHHNPPGSHLVGRKTGGGHIADGLLQCLRVGVRQIDKVWGVKGQGNPRLPGAFSQLSGRLRPDMDPLAALVLIAGEAQPRDPAGGVQRGFIAPRKAFRVARRSKSGAHKNALLLPSTRNGVSTA